MKEADLFNNPSTSKNVFLLSLLELFYFSAVYLINAFDIRHVMIGVIGELLTIPMLLLLPVLIVISVILLLRQKFSYRSYPGFSLLVLCGAMMLMG